MFWFTRNRLPRALVGAPKLVVMDEPSLGLSSKLIDEYFDIVAEINRRGTTVFLIEQNAERALSIGHRGYLVVKGRIVASGHIRGADIERRGAQALSLTW